MGSTERRRNGSSGASESGSERESTQHGFDEGLSERSSPSSASTWAQVLSSIEGDESAEMALLKKFAGDLPMAWRRVPDFRIPPEIAEKWRKSRVWQRVRTLLHEWRMKHEPEYMRWTMLREEKWLRKSSGADAWEKSAQRAKTLLRKIENSGTATFSDLFVMESSVAVLEDRFASTTEKMRAVTNFGSIAAKYEAREVKEPEVDKETEESLKEATPSSIASMFEHLGRIQSEQAEPGEPEPDHR